MLLLQWRWAPRGARSCAGGGCWGSTGSVIGQGEREHYRIRWQDGHESVYFPGPDARVMAAG